MRVFLALPLLIAAAKAFDLNAYHTGFSTGMGFDQSEMQDGTTCFAEVMTIVASLKTSAEAEDINGFLSTLQGAKTQFLTACEPYLQDFENYAQAHATSNPQEVLNQYFPQVVQAIAQWAQFISQGEDQQAGQQEAYILQVLMGAQVPVALNLPQIDFTKYVPFNENNYFNQYLTAYLTGLGASNVQNDISQIVQCVNTVQNQLVPSVQTFEQNFATGDFDGKIDALQSLADNTFATIKDCQGAIAVDMQFLIPTLEAFKEDPVNFILSISSNVALNLPELMENNANTQADTIYGDYTDAGTLQAQNVNTIFNGVVSFAN